MLSKKMGKRLTTAISFIGMTIGIWLTSETIARADHSLKNAMSDSITIAEAVNQIQSTHGVVCDTENSNQIYYYPSEEEEAGSAWKQIALCYQDENSRLRFLYFICLRSSFSLCGSSIDLGDGTVELERVGNSYEAWVSLKPGYDVELVVRLV